MKAMLIGEGQTLVWTDVDLPKVGEDEVLIRVKYAGVNRADLLQREGKYPSPTGSPPWCGLEVSGTVERVEGERAAAKWKIGDEVCALLGGGGYSEYVSVPYGMVMPVPKGVSMAQAAAIPEAFATAYLNLFSEAGAKPGETVLVHAGASGLSSVIIPMAKAFGLRVLTTVRSDEKARAILPLGADRIVNTKTEDLYAVMEEEKTAGHGVDVAIDCLSGPGFGESLRHVNRGARWVLIAALAGTCSEVNLQTVYKTGIRIIGSTLRSRTPAAKAQILDALVRDVFPLIESGTIRPSIYATVPITDADRAHRMLYESKNVGKVVLSFNEN